MDGCIDSIGVNGRHPITIQIDIFLGRFKKNFYLLTNHKGIHQACTQRTVSAAQSRHHLEIHSGQVRYRESWRLGTPNMPQSTKTSISYQKRHKRLETTLNINSDEVFWVYAICTDVSLRALYDLLPHLMENWKAETVTIWPLVIWENGRLSDIIAEFNSHTSGLDK